MINMIFAIDEKGGLGYKGGLPWPHMAADIERYLDFTRNSTIVFGRTTYETSETLTGKHKILLTTSDIHAPDVEVVHDIKNIARRAEHQDIWVIGGSKVFRSMLPYADRIYMTIIHGEFPADTFFTFNTHNWKLIEKQSFQKDANNPYDYDFETYEKLRP